MYRFFGNLPRTMLPQPGEAPNAFNADAKKGWGPMGSGLDSDIAMLIVNLEFCARFIDFWQIACGPAEEDTLPRLPDGMKNI